MTKPLYLLSISLIVSLSSLVVAQTDRQDKALLVEPRNEFLDSIKNESHRFHKQDQPLKKQLRMDFSRVSIPAFPDEFMKYWHNEPISQGLSGMCWCFSATSFYESEIYRLTQRKIKLSELYTVYWEYVEKARRFIQERGHSEFGQGSEANAVPRIWKAYGIVPAEAYTGLQPGQKFHDHDKMYDEMHAYLQSIRVANAWNEEQVIATIKDILNHYLGVPPTTVKVGERMMTPKEYLTTIVRLKLDEYVEFMSLMEKPYNQMAEYEVPDNWWHNREYYNIRLDDFMMIIKRAIRKGFTLCIGGDTSEPGYEGHAGIAVVPTFDIPSTSIDENARQLRFSNNTTQDDHGIHIVGYCEKEGKDWYLVKDSGAGSRNSSHSGYYLYHEDYVKLKMMGFTVHRSIAEDLLKQFPR